MKESKYYYAVRVKYGRFSFLARQNPSAPALFWFHEDAVEHRKKCGNGKDVDIIKVFVRWSKSGITYNEPGNMFRSKKELKSPPEPQPEGYSPMKRINSGLRVDPRII